MLLFLLGINAFTFLWSLDVTPRSSSASSRDSAQRFDSKISSISSIRFFCKNECMLLAIYCCTAFGRAKDALRGWLERSL
ncbi:hypothetical protein EDD21DRAFT_372431 [Dissophora ornata]|nr:hypothetical protein EDD21DRAFT_372431 [Dissophora ornata]